MISVYGSEDGKTKGVASSFSPLLHAAASLHIYNNSYSIGSIIIIVSSGRREIIIMITIV